MSQTCKHKRTCRRKHDAHLLRARAPGSCAPARAFPLAISLSSTIQAQACPSPALSMWPEMAKKSKGGTKKRFPKQAPAD